METPEIERPKELCTLTIAFPVVSDDAAMEVKKKVTAILADNPDAVIDFRMRGMPKNVLPVR